MACVSCEKGSCSRRREPPLELVPFPRSRGKAVASQTMAQRWQVHSQGLHAGRSAALGHDSCTNLAQNLRKVLCNFLRVLCFADGCDTRAEGCLSERRPLCLKVGAVTRYQALAQPTPEALDWIEVWRLWGNLPQQYLCLSVDANFTCPKSLHSRPKSARSARKKNAKRFLF